MRSNFISHAPEAFIVPLTLLLTTRLSFGAIGLMLMGAMLMFYRGASEVALQKASQLSPDMLVCPCNGRVIDIIQYSNGLTQIAVFLNVHNVHVQYIPIDGTVRHVKHKPGTFHAAYIFVKSQYNERIETTICTVYGDIHVIQIAGMLARRILSFWDTPNRLGTQATRMSPLGLIKFGSRVDIWVPTASIAEIFVKRGNFLDVGDPLARLKVKA